MLAPVGFFLSTIVFFLGIQQEGYKRRALALLHITIISFCFVAQRQGVSQLPMELVAFLVGWTVHTSGVLLLDSKSPGLLTMRRVDKLKVAISLWTDFRGIQRNHSPSDSHTSHKARFNFGLRKTINAVTLLSMNRGINEYLIQPWLEFLGIIPHDFSPAKQGVLPALETEDMALRLVVSTQWIWTTCFLLTASHNLCAVLFVSILGWSDKSNWPPLYGPVWHAYSLRRFWGSFWHRLHLVPYDRFTLPILDYHNDTSNRNVSVKKAMRSMMIFLMSAACHGVVNLVVYGQPSFATEIRFFLCNWAVCLLETILAQAAKSSQKQIGLKFIAQYRAIKLIRRTCGYALMLAFFFCTVPAWRYPLVYNSFKVRHG